MKVGIINRQLHNRDAAPLRSMYIRNMHVKHCTNQRIQGAVFGRLILQSSNSKELQQPTS
jgi:hypothetical protein